MFLLQAFGLPYEMIEMILLKSVAAFYARHRARGVDRGGGW
jgi:hypothetical protein